MSLFVRDMYAFKLVFLAKACIKVVVRSVKIGEVKDFHVNPYNKVLLHLMI